MPVLVQAYPDEPDKLDVARRVRQTYLLFGDPATRLSSGPADLLLRHRGMQMLNCGHHRPGFPPVALAADQEPERPGYELYHRLASAVLDAGVSVYVLPTDQIGDDPAHG